MSNIPELDVLSHKCVLFSDFNTWNTYKSSKETEKIYNQLKRRGKLSLIESKKKSKDIHFFLAKKGDKTLFRLATNNGYSKKVFEMVINYAAVLLKTGKIHGSMCTSCRLLDSDGCIRRNMHAIMK